MRSHYTIVRRAHNVPQVKKNLGKLRLRAYIAKVGLNCVLDPVCQLFGDQPSEGRRLSQALKKAANMALASPTIAR